MVTVDDVRAVLARLPRSSEVLVRDRVKFRVGQIVYVAFSQDETEIGRELFISDTTVKTHVTRLLQKLEVRDRAQAIVLAYQSGLFDA